tara:strand:+ start:70 stop:321 length:252 start_codon:yes stop_codon:yes gene_type:complete
MLIDPQGRMLRSKPGGVPMEVPPEYLKMLNVLADTSARIHLGLHCSLCHEDVVGSNGGTDSRWTMRCGCRTFVGGNPTASKAS